LLARTFAATTSTKPTSPDVTDTLRPDGIVHNYRYAGGPLVPIRYTIRGQVERIGDPAVTTFPFSARYAYLPNGLVDTAEFSSAGSPAQQQRYRYALGPSGYDALNRLRSADFSSWTGTQWTVTPTYDLSGITYDASGNLRSLRRNRDTGSTFIDNLSYTIAGTSNRLDTVTDAVLSTPEPWDAESGNFTYDLTGNVVTAPAPYSLTAVAYDPSNLPLSITRNNTTTRYRYDDAGQRIYKQVNGGNIEVYIREGGTPLAVFTLRPNGNHQSSYFNLVWEARVIGRLPSSGSRSYYHFDALGSTRAVTQGATITESYDFEPWGLLMAGRTRAGTTKEGFTSKERDTETGLDYFGARYYMPAIGRWAAVDPVSDDMAEWSPYNYVYNNPLTRTDPDGRQPPHMWLPPESAEGAQQVVNLTGHFIKGAAKAAVGIVTLVHTALTLDENTPDFGPFTGIQQAVQTLRTGTPEEKAEAAGGLTFGAVTAAYGLRGAGGPKPVALTERAGQIHGVLDPIAQTQRTTAVLETNTGRIAAGGVRDLTPAQRRAAVAGGDQPARLPGAHAEVTALKAAERSGATPQAIGTSRNICPACRDYIQSKGGVVTGPRTAVWPKKDQ
jgi:RHS repeat-associated protein